MPVIFAQLLPNPLHPAVVHFPIVFAVLAPIVAIGALVFIQRGSRANVSWGLSVLVLAGLAMSSWLAVETGEDQEDRVEKVVAEAPFETHEEAAERFLYLSAGLLALGVVGFAPRRLGSAARLVTTVGTVGLLVAGYQVGHSGGELVYRHGAAAAYTGDQVVPVATGGDAKEDDSR